MDFVWEGLIMTKPMSAWSPEECKEIDTVLERLVSFSKEMKDKYGADYESSECTESEQAMGLKLVRESISAITEGTEQA